MPVEAPIQPAIAPAATPDFSKYDAIVASAQQATPSPEPTPDFSKYDAIVNGATAPESAAALPNLGVGSPSPTPQPDFSKYDAIIHPDSTETAQALTETNQIVLPRMGTMGTETDLFNLDTSNPPEWINNASQAAAEELNNFIPKSPEQVAALLSPPVQMMGQEKEIFNTIKDWAGGAPLNQAIIKNDALVSEFAAAEGTPALSKERFKVVFNVLAQLGMLYAGAKSLTAKPKLGEITNASQITSPEGVPVPTLRQEVGGGTSLRQQGAPAGARAEQAAGETAVAQNAAQTTAAGDVVQPPPETPATGLTEPPAALPVEPVKGTGRFRRSYAFGQDVGDSMNGLAASRDSGMLRGTLEFRNIAQGLSSEQINNLGKYLVSERLKTVNPEHPQILSDAETAAIKADPKIQKALQRYRNTVKPEIESLRKRAGLTEEAAAGKSEEFISLIPETDEMLPPKPGPSNVPIMAQSKTTRFAKAALGEAAKYSTNLKDILSESYSEVIKKTRLRDLYGLLNAKGIVSSEQVPEIMGHTAEAVDLGRAKAGAEGSGLPGLAWMPKDLASDLRDVLETPPASSSPISKAAQKLQRIVTGISLTANPQEVLNHMRRQLNVAAANPPVGVNPLVRLMEAVTPYIGPKAGTFARVLTTDMNLPENQAILKDIFDAGGGSSRAFHQYQTNILGLKQLQATTAKLMFAIPEGKGVVGWDLRMRVQLEKIRRIQDGNTTPQAIRDFVNQLGQYTDKPDWMIQAIKKVNPYAATTLPLRWTEIKQLFGTSGLKGKTLSGKLGLQAETFLRGAGGTLLGLAAANYMLSGKYPWENEPGHEFDLNTGAKDTDGRTIYVPLRVLAPELSRPINSLSVLNVLKEAAAGDKADYIAAAGLGPANQGLAIFGGGPLGNFATTALTGNALYLMKQPGSHRAPSLMDVAKSKERSRGVEQLIQAGRSINPAFDLAAGALLPGEDTKTYQVQAEPFKSLEAWVPVGNMFVKGSKPAAAPVKVQRLPVLGKTRHRKAKKL